MTTGGNGSSVNDHLIILSSMAMVEHFSVIFGEVQLNT